MRRSHTGPRTQLDYRKRHEDSFEGTVLRQYYRMKGHLGRSHENEG